jgi:hypothetical protein
VTDAKVDWPGKGQSSLGIPEIKSCRKFWIELTAFPGGSTQKTSTLTSW